MGKRLPAAILLVLPLAVEFCAGEIPGSQPGIAVQKSRFQFTIGESRVQGRLELSGTWDSRDLPRTLRWSVPPTCAVTSVDTNAVSSWRLRDRTLILELRRGGPADLRLVLNTVSPIHSLDSPIALPLPKLESARRAEGVFTLQNVGPHAISTCELPPGFQLLPDDRLTYEFFSLDESASASLSLFQPRARIRPSVSALLSLNEQTAEIVRHIRLQSETAPVFASHIRIPADESISKLRMIEGTAEVRRDSNNGISLDWSRGLPPGKFVVVEIATQKSLAWNQGTALVRLESLHQPDGPWSGSLSLRATGTLLVRPVRNPRLRPVPAADLPSTLCAAWNHDDYDALLVEIKKREPVRTAWLSSQVTPSLSVPKMTGELRIDPGDAPLEEVELSLDAPEIRDLRFRSPLVSAIHFEPQTRVLRAVLRVPQASPLTLPWELQLPAPIIQEEDTKRLASFEIPLLRVAGIPLKGNNLSFLNQPFTTLRFASDGFDPVPAGDPTQAGELDCAAVFAASAPIPSIRVTCEEIGTSVEPPWEIGPIALSSQVAAYAPHRHHCQIVLSGSPVPRKFPLVLPPGATLLSVRLRELPVSPLISIGNPREILIPIPADPESLRLQLDYLTQEPPWKGSGETTLTPPGLPDRTLTQSCEWTVKLPKEFDYSDFGTNLSFSVPPLAPPITLRPILALFSQGNPGFSHSGVPSTSRASVLTFRGDFSPSPLSFHYVHGERRLFLALLWVGCGVVAFFVFARERPVYFGLFGLLLLSFLPVSGLTPLRALPDGLLLGWMAGGLVFAANQLLRRGRQFFSKPAGALRLVFFAFLGALFLQSASSSEALPEPAMASPTGPPPAKARARVALGLFPTTQRLGLDLRFEHPGRALDRYFLELPSEFRLIRASGDGQPCRAEPSKIEPGSSRIDLILDSPRRDSANFALEWEAPLAADASSLAILLPTPRAESCEIALTLAAVPPRSASFRNAAHFPPDAAFLPADWGPAARVQSAVHPPNPRRPVWIDLRRPPEKSVMDLSQLCLVGGGNANAFCLVQIQTNTPWQSTSLDLDPAVRVRDVQGVSLLDWTQMGNQLLIRRAPCAETSVPFLISLGWDPVALSGEIPYPLLTSSKFARGAVTAAVAAGPGLKILNARPATAASEESLLFRLSPPLRVQAHLDSLAEAGHPPPRLVASPPVFRSQVAVEVSLELQQAVLSFEIDTIPQDASLESLTIQIPAHIPAIQWFGPCLRDARAESTNGLDVHTLSFTGPVSEPTTFSGSVTLPLPASGLRVPLPVIAGASQQHRYFLVHSRGGPEWSVQMEGVEEIALKELPWPRTGSSKARAFASVSESASLFFTQVAPPPAPAPNFSGVLDLHVASTLKRNGESSHLAQAWLLPPPEELLELELPACSVLTAVRLNGAPIPVRSVSGPNPKLPGFRLALPKTLSREIPSLLEIAYHSAPENPRSPREPRIDFRFSAPRLDALPVAQTAWQVHALEGFELRSEDGNLYPVKPSEFQHDRFESLTSLARGLRRSFETENPSPEQRALIRNRILALTSFAGSRWQGGDLLPILEEARSLRKSAWDDAQSSTAAPSPSAALVGPWAAVDRAFQAHATTTKQRQISRKQRVPSLSPHASEIYLSDQVGLDSNAAPWLTSVATFQPNPLLAPPERPAANPMKDPAAPARMQPGVSSPTLFSVPVEFPPPTSAAVFFKKLKGDAQLHLIATPASDPGTIWAWLGFGAALALLMGMERVGRLRQPRQSR